MGFSGRWSEDGLTERLLTLHAEGRHTIREMTNLLAKEFHIKLTKNAVIGKLHRLKLETPKIVVTSRRKKTRPKPAPRPVFKPRVVKPKVEATVGFVYYPPKPAASRNLSIYQLNRHTCKFPTSGAGEDCRFCGLSVDILPYCPYHTSVATVPASKRWK